MTNKSDKNTAAVPTKLKNSINWNSIIKDFYIYALLLLIVLIFSVARLDKVSFFGRGHFLSSANIINLLRSAVPIMTVSAAFTLLMISENIDLSVGSAMSLNAVVFALLILNGFGFFPAVLITMLLGFVCGFINGYLTMKLRITPVIATLVTLSLFKGVALLIVPNGLSAIKSSGEKIMPAWINDYARKDVLLGLPMAFYVTLLVVGFLILMQKKTVLGKYTAAIGGNRTAAELSGINTKKVAWGLYIIMGVYASLAGIARASYMSLGDPLSGDGMQLDCIIAVLLGGTSFYGGEGSIAKTLIGALIIICVTTGLMTIVPPYWQLIAKGGIFILAVVLSNLLTKERVKA
jgi:ribose transport system permease protein